MNPQRRTWLFWGGLVVWSSMLVLITYGSTINLPYRLDDYFHIPCVNTYSLTTIWQQACGYYFRPIPFTIWKIMYALLGRNDLVAQHALNFGLHLLNGLLVAWLADRLWADPDRIDWRRRFLSATLFLLFPFSYEAVPWIGALVHPLVTCLILISVSAYLKMRLTGNRRWGVLSLGVAFFAPFAHENGVLIAPLLVAIELTRLKGAEPLVKRCLRPVLWLVPIVLWWSIWRSVPSQYGGEHIALNSIKNMLRDGVYVAQGSGYPLTWLGGQLRDSLAINGFVVAVTLSLIALACATFIQWRSKSDRRSLLPWLWIPIASAPVIVFLDYSYVSAAPRMLMLASVGIAWLWTDAILKLASWQRSIKLKRAGQALAIGLGALIVVQSYAFIQGQIHLFELGGTATSQMVADTVSANKLGQPAIFLNLPVWVAAPRTTYAVGQEGIIFLTFFDHLSDAVTTHTQRPAQAQGFHVDAIRQAVPYYVGVYGPDPDWSQLAQSGGQVFAAVYATDTVHLQPVGVLSDTISSTQWIADFDGEVSLREANAEITDNGLQLDLLWQVNQPLPSNATVFVHVLNASGQIVAQADGDPLAGSYPFSSWPRNFVAWDTRWLDVRDKNLSIRVGLYDRATGQRLTARSDAGTPFADNAVPIPIQPSVDP